MAKKIMRTFKIAEISGVDRPCQQGAKALLMKRAPDPKEFTKGAMMTAAAMGHTHLVSTSNHDGSEAKSGFTSYEGDHSHPWIMNEDGSITIGEVMGHTHEIAVVAKTEAPGLDDEKVEKEAPMPDTNLEAQVADLTKKLSRATKLAELTDVQKAHFEKMDEAAQDAFLGATPDARQAEVDAAVTKAAQADPVVYTTDDGIELRKSDGAAVLAMAKKADAAAKETAELKKAAAETALRKRAEDELSHLPGDVETHVALLGAVDGIGDEDVRKSALEILKAKDAGAAAAQTTLGVEGQPQVDTTAGDSLDELAKKHQAENPGMSFAKAYDAVLETEQGQALYAKSVG